MNAKFARGQCQFFVDTGNDENKKKKGVRAEKASEKPNAETTFKRVEFIYIARKKSNKKTSSRRVKEKKSGEARVETVEGYKTVEK